MGLGSALRNGLHACLFLVLALAPQAWAQKKSDPRLSEARTHYEKGQAYYDMAKYAEAIAEFEKAYLLSRAPGLLYNMAQAHRLNNDCGQALTFYRNYLRAYPSAENREEVETRIKEMEQCQRDQAPRAVAPPVVPALPAVAPPPRTPAPVLPPLEERPASATPERRIEVPPSKQGHSPKRFRLAAWSTGGAGILLLGAGVYWGLQANRTYGELEDKCREECTWSNADSGQLSDADREKRLSFISMGLGAVALGTGAVLYTLGGRPNEAKAPAISLHPTPNGTSLVYSCEF
ncbi:MAG: hypothetical protein HY698_18325 [Deltaproteobacteria bacterium]|nr:hypothetical protein [Deltaproteobacteria bacterium]